MENKGQKWNLRKLLLLNFEELTDLLRGKVPKKALAFINYGCKSFLQLNEKLVDSRFIMWINNQNYWVNYRNKKCLEFMMNILWIRILMNRWFVRV